MVLPVAAGAAPLPPDANAELPAVDPGTPDAALMPAFSWAACSARALVVDHVSWTGEFWMVCSKDEPFQT